MIKKIDHINIVVSNLEKSTAFFVDLLGFKINNKGHLAGEWIDRVVGLNSVDADYVQLILPEAQTRLELIKYHHPESDRSKNIAKSNQIGFRHMALEVTDIEQVYHNLQQAGVKILSELQTYNGSKKLCYFLGPDNIILELAEYGSF